MRSLVRILVGVLIGVGIFVSLGFIGQKFPALGRVIFYGFIIQGAAGFVLWTVIRSLKRGVIIAKFSTYERDTSPFSFWFYVCFYIFLSLAFLSLGIDALFFHHFIS